MTASESMLQTVSTPKQSTAGGMALVRQAPTPESPQIAATITPTAGTIVPADDGDSYSITAFADVTDRSLHAAVARFTGGLVIHESPRGLE